MATREWLTFAFVAVLGGRESQFGDHVTGTGPVGGRRDELIAAITQLLPFIGYPRPFNALKIINDEMFA